MNNVVNCKKNLSISSQLVVAQTNGQEYESIKLHCTHTIGHSLDFQALKSQSGQPSIEEHRDHDNTQSSREYELSHFSLSVSNC